MQSSHVILYKKSEIKLSNQSPNEINGRQTPKIVKLKNNSTTHFIRTNFKAMY